MFGTAFTNAISSLWKKLNNTPGSPAIQPKGGEANSGSKPTVVSDQHETQPASVTVTPVQADLAKPLRYLIATDAQVIGNDNEIIEVGYSAPKPMHGIGVRYCNLFNQTEKDYGPYLPSTDTARVYKEQVVNPLGDGWQRLLADQCHSAIAAGFELIEWDNPDGYGQVAVLGAVGYAASRGLKVFAKNPLVCGWDILPYVQHPAIVGIIVEKDEDATPILYDNLRKAVGKPDLPIWFVSFGDDKGWASKTAAATANFRNMWTSYSPDGEYTSSQDVGAAAPPPMTAMPARPEAQGRLETSSSGRQFIESFEGLFLQAYDDANDHIVAPGQSVHGTLTIGYGHTTAAGAPKVYVGQTITQAEADHILAADLAAVEKDVGGLVKVPLTQNQFDALVSFQFNTGGLGRSSVLAELNRSHYAAAANALLLWNRGNGKVLDGLVRRRNAEKAIFLKPDSITVASIPASAPAMPQAVLPTMLILRGIAGTFAGTNYPRGALDEPSALEYAQRHGYVGRVLDVSGETGPTSAQTLLALREFRRDQSVCAWYVFSGGAYNLRHILAALTPAEKARIKRLVVLGAPNNPETTYQGPWELVYRTDPPTGHMDGPRALLNEAAPLAPIIEPPKPVLPADHPAVLDLGQRIKRTMLAKNYPWFDDQNVVSVEGMNPDGAPNKNRPNAFDDIKMVLNGDGKIIGGPWEGTTQPGVYWTTHPMASGGAFIIALGPQACWTPGDYHGDAWRQSEDSSIMGTRDPGCTYKRQGPPVKHGNIGVHHHQGHDLPRDNIANAAAGCQVIRLRSDQEDFMRITRQCPRYKTDTKGYRLTATVLEAKDVLS